MSSYLGQVYRSVRQDDQPAIAGKDHVGSDRSGEELPEEHSPPIPYLNAIRAT